MRKVTITFITLTIAFLSIQSAQAQKTKYQSVFIYNFSKYIKWPDNYNTEKFVIGVLGESEIVADLKSMVSSKKKANGLDMELRIFSSISEMEDCNLLFVTDKFCPKIKEIQNAISGKPTLIVTDAPGLAKKGASINFVEQDGKIKFELNLQNAESKGLKVAGALSSLAIIV